MTIQSVTTMWRKLSYGSSTIRAPPVRDKSCALQDARTCEIHDDKVYFMCNGVLHSGITLEDVHISTIDVSTAVTHVFLQIKKQDRDRIYELVQPHYPNASPDRDDEHCDRDGDCTLKDSHGQAYVTLPGSFGVSNEAHSTSTQDCMRAIMTDGSESCCRRTSCSLSMSVYKHKDASGTSEQISLKFVLRSYRGALVSRRRGHQAGHVGTRAE